MRQMIVAASATSAYECARPSNMERMKSTVISAAIRQSPIQAQINEIVNFAKKFI